MVESSRIHNEVGCAVLFFFDKADKSFDFYFKLPTALSKIYFTGTLSDPELLDA